MRLTRMAGVLALTLALVAIGCGPQHPDNKDNQNAEETAEEVYIFPDGTEVRGEAAAWLHSLEFPEAFWDLRHEDVSRSFDAFKEWVGDIRWVPSELPDDFRFLGVVASGPNYGPHQRRIVLAAPERRELFVADIARIGHTGAKVIPGKKPADYRCAYEYPPGVPDAQPLNTFNGVSHYCQAKWGLPGDVLLNWALINTPEEEARRILYSAPAQWH